MTRDRTYPAAVDDPAWIMSKYEEAKDLLSDIRADLATDHGSLEADLHARVEGFWLETFMDGCTTMGLDCGCNRPPGQKERNPDA